METELKRLKDNEMRQAVPHQLTFDSQERWQRQATQSMGWDTAQPLTLAYLQNRL